MIESSNSVKVLASDRIAQNGIKQDVRQATGEAQELQHKAEGDKEVAQNLQIDDTVVSTTGQATSNIPVVGGWINLGCQIGSGVLKVATQVKQQEAVAEQTKANQATQKTQENQILGRKQPSFNLNKY